MTDRFARPATATTPTHSTRTLHQGTIRVGIIGCGFGAQVHIPALHMQSGVRITAVCSRRAERANDAARSNGIPFVTVDWRELIRHGEIDAVIIATPPYLHHQMTLGAIEAKKHVLVEKPISRSVAEARDMARLAGIENVVAMVNHQYRYLPARARARELIQEGFIGDPQTASMVVHRSNLNDPDGTPFGWLMEQDKGGGMLGASGSHHIDALRWWFGEVRSVSGTAATMVRRRRLPDAASYAPVDADDSFACLLKFANGALGTIHFTATAAYDLGEQITLSGSHGLLLMPGDGRLYGARRGERTLAEIPLPERLSGNLPSSSHPLINATALLQRAWLNAIRTGETTAPTFEDGAKAQEVIDGVIKSSQQGRWIDLSGSRWATP